MHQPGIFMLFSRVLVRRSGCCQMFLGLTDLPPFFFALTFFEVLSILWSKDATVGDEREPELTCPIVEWCSAASDVLSVAVVT